MTDPLKLQSKFLLTGRSVTWRQLSVSDRVVGLVVDIFWRADLMWSIGCLEHRLLGDVKPLGARNVTCVLRALGTPLCVESENGSEARCGAVRRSLLKQRDIMEDQEFSLAPPPPPSQEQVVLPGEACSYFSHALWLHIRLT